MNRLDTVQGLRAIAAWFVVISHGALWAVEFGPLGLPMRTFDMLGSLGVLMFFTLSGFIMVHISRRSYGDPDAPAQFLRRRIVRIVPLYWLMTLLAAAMAIKNAEPLGIVHFASSLLFVPHLESGPLMRPVLGVGWTLNYEMFFYLLFAVSLFLRKGLAVLAATIIALLAAGQALNPVWDFHNPRNVQEAWTAPFLLPFLLGIGLAVLRAARPAMRVRHPFLLLGPGCAGGLLLQELLVPPDTYPGWWLVAVLVLGALLASCAILASEKLKTPAWLVFTGDASYSLYLVHPLLFGVARRLGGEALAQWRPYLAIAFYVALSTVTAFALYLFVERPLTRWLSQRWQAPQARQVPA